jgi:hypothetical protein
MYGTLLAEKSTHDCRNGGLRVERAHCHGIFGLLDYHQERTSPTYSQRKNNSRQLHLHPQKQLCPKCGCPEMKCFVWDFIGRKINQRNPKCQNIDELRTAILQEISTQPLQTYASCCKKCTIRALCGLVLSSMNIGLSANAWLSKWGTTPGASTLSRYFWPVLYLQ